MSIYVRCPFCNETDFDLIGLKDHLLRWCDEFRNTEAPRQAPIRGCQRCKHQDTDMPAEPCVSCLKHDSLPMFEPNEQPKERIRLNDGQMEGQ